MEQSDWEGDADSAATEGGIRIQAKMAASTRPVVRTIRKRLFVAMHPSSERSRHESPLGRANRRRGVGSTRLHHREHPQPRFLDDRFGRPYEIAGEAEESEERNEPLCGIPLVPPHTVAKVGWKFVMEIVVPLAVRDEGEQRVSRPELPSV